MITLKPNGVSTHDVFVDGQRRATLHFTRSNNRGYVTTRGYFRNIASGKEVDIGCYCYFSDVRKNIPYLLEETAP